MAAAHQSGQQADVSARSKDRKVRQPSLSLDHRSHWMRLFRENQKLSPWMTQPYSAEDLATGEAED